MYFIQKIRKILNRFEIKNKFFDIVIDNVDNNNTLKIKIEKILNRREFH